MTDRRRDSLFQGAGSPTYQKVMQKVEDGNAAVTERMEAGFDRIIGKIERMERDIAQGEQDRASITRELGEVRRDLGEVRDAANMNGQRVVAQAAKGAAAGATEAAGVVAEKIAGAAIPQNKWGKYIAWAVGFTALVVALEKVPTTVRAVERTWVYLSNRDNPIETKADAKAGQ